MPHLNTISEDSTSLNEASDVGISMDQAAQEIAGLLDDDGHFNPDSEQLSRGHPDYVEENDSRNSKVRDEKGRFTKQETSKDETDDAQDTANASSDDVEDEIVDDADNVDNDNAEKSSDDSEDAENQTFETLGQLSEALEIPLDELTRQISHTYSTDEGDVTLSLEDMVQSHIQKQRYEKEHEEVRQEFDTRRQLFDQNNTFLAASLQAAENIIAAELEDPRLAALRESDAAEWMARREEISQRLAQMRGAREHAAQQYQMFINQSMMQLKERETKALNDAIPNFDAKMRDGAKNVIESLGFSSQETAQILDHRLVKAAVELHDLREEVTKLREMKKSADKTAKKITNTLPKMTKPGKQQTAGVKISRDKLTRLRNRAKKSGRVEDAAAVIEHMDILN